MRPWYVIQTQTGKEEQLAEMIRRILPEERRGECFAAYSEQIRHRGSENRIHVLRMFPGYVFLASDDIEQTFRSIRELPAMAKILSVGGYAFTPMYEEEAAFLLNMMDRDHIVRLSYVATDGKDHVLYVSGPLERCMDRIQSYRFRKRCAQVRLRVAGQDKTAPVGIILNDDIRREVSYGKVEAPVAVPERYRVKQKETGSGKARPKFSAGEMVCVTEGAFEGSVGRVQWAKKEKVRVAVQMFGRELSVEVPIESVAAEER